MKTLMKITIVLLGVGLFLPAVYAWDTGEVQISPFVGYVFSDDIDSDYYDYDEKIELDDDFTWGLRVGVGVASGLALEWQLSHTPTTFYLKAGDFFDESKEKISDVDMYIMQGSLIVDFTETRVVPYFVFGLGATLFDMDNGDNKTRFTGSLGGGMRIKINEAVSFRAEIRGYAIRINDDDCYYSDDGYYYECDTDDDYLKLLETTFGLSIRI